MENLSIDDYARMVALYADENKQLGMVVKEMHIRLANAQEALNATNEPATEDTTPAQAQDGTVVD